METFLEVCSQSFSLFLSSSLNFSPSSQQSALYCEALNRPVLPLTVRSPRDTLIHCCVGMCRVKKATQNSAFPREAIFLNTCYQKFFEIWRISQMVHTYSPPCLLSIMVSCSQVLNQSLQVSQYTYFWLPLGPLTSQLCFLKGEF